MTVQDAQVRKLVEEMMKHGRIGVAAVRAGMDRKYVTAEQLPSAMKQPRRWRTRLDPFEAHWAWVQEQLEKAPELEAKKWHEATQPTLGKQPAPACSHSPSPMLPPCPSHPVD